MNAFHQFKAYPTAEFREVVRPSPRALRPWGSANSGCVVAFRRVRETRVDKARVRHIWESGRAILVPVKNDRDMATPTLGRAQSDRRVHQVD